MKYLNNKKGQGAMEYLMTYGWAIMVVLIVGIVLWQLGIFNLGGTAKTYEGFGAVKPLSWGIRAPATGDGVATMVNGEGVAIIPFNCTSGAGSEVVICEKKKCNKEKHYTYILECTVVASGPVPAGSEFKLIFHNCTVNCTGENAGDPYNILLSVNYNKTIGTTTETHLSTGALHGNYE